MRILSYILLILTIGAISLQSQGFDWQYSSRLPFRYPYLFAGLNGGVDYEMHDAALDLSENNFGCCQFNQGSGFGTVIGLKSEFWLKGLWAVNMQISYLTRRANFTADGYQVPFTVFDRQGKIIGHDTATFENEMQSSLSYITLELGGKRRLFGSHLFAGASIELGYLVTQKYTQIERVLGPSYFKYNDGSQERNLGDYTFGNIQNFIFTPKLLIGYDIPLGLGLYTTPYFSVGFPLQNVAETGKWNIWSFNFGISILRSIAYQ